MLLPGSRGGQAGPALAVLLETETAGAETRRFGARIASYASTDSTNDVARELAAQGVPEGSVVVADQQLRGRGRLGRQWISPPGGGLWLSVVLRPPIPLSLLGPLALVAATGARSAVEELTGMPCAVKWPNDLLLCGRKVAGILTEASGGSAGSPPDFVIMGIGVNVNLLPEQIPAWLIDRAISLAMATGRDWSIPEVGAAVLARMEDSYRRFITGGFDALRQEWIAGSETIGRLVTVTTASGDLTGLAETVDSYGRLVLRLEDGRTQYVASGDVALAGNATGGVTHSTRP